MSGQTSGSETGEFDDVLERLSEAIESSGGHPSERDETVDIDDLVDSEGEIDLFDARDVGRAIAGELLGSPLDGIVEVVERDEGGWRVVAEVVERNSIPDTQDILGRYVISLDPNGSVRGYGRAGRYRRGDVATQTEVFEAEER